MKRYFSHTALAALLLTVALAGCQREPLPGDGAVIRFSVASPVISAEETKATDPDKPHERTYLVQKTRPVKLFGCSTETGSTERTLLFDDVALSCTDLDTEKWEYSPLKYWIQDGTHDFRAVFPAPAAGNYGYDKDNDELDVQFTMGPDDELLVASAQYSAASRTNDKVALNFQHACAAVRFLFTDGTNEYVLKSFQLENITTAGTLSYGSTTTWTPSSTDTKVYPWALSSWAIPPVDAQTGEGAAPEGWYFVIPQSLSTTADDAAVVSFTYAVGPGATDQVLPVTLKLNTSGSTSNITAWEAGKIYTYKISIQANAIDFDVTWTDWVAGHDDFNYIGD